MKRDTSRGGQSLVEFAVTMPFVIFFLVFAVYAFLTCCDYLTLQQITREALRLTVQDEAKALDSVKRSGDLLLIYHIVDVDHPMELKPRPNDAPPSARPDGKEGQLYQDSTHASITVAKNEDVPNILAFLRFASEDEAVEFPPPRMNYRLDRR